MNVSKMTTMRVCTFNLVSITHATINISNYYYIKELSILNDDEEESPNNLETVSCPVDATGKSIIIISAYSN